VAFRQEGAEGLHGPVLEEERRRERSEVPLEPRDQFLRDERVDPVPLEGGPVADPARRNPEDLGEDRLHVAPGEPRKVLAREAHGTFRHRGRRRLHRLRSGPGRGSGGARRARVEAVALGDDHALRTELAPGLARRRKAPDAPEAPLEEERLPARAVEEGRAGQPLGLVLETPPAAGQAEDEGRRPVADGHLVDDQEPVRPERPLDVREGGPDVARGVQDVAPEDEVDAVRRDPLLLGRALEVQETELDERVGGSERAPAVLQETSGHVGVEVPERAPRVRQGREDEGAGGPRPGPHLQDRDRPGRVEPSPLVHVRPDEAGHEPAAGVRLDVSLVDLLHERDRAAREENLHVVPPPREDVRVGVQAVP